MQVVVLNGVNLDVLGRRDPEIYGGISLGDLETRIYEWASQLGCHVRCRQTNNEGEYVGWCHDALDWADAVIVNPGAWTHYSYAIRDALLAVAIPAADVHLSDVDNRPEPFRKISVVRDVCAYCFKGAGIGSYLQALDAFAAGRAQDVPPG